MRRLSSTRPPLTLALAALLSAAALGGVLPPAADAQPEGKPYFPPLRLRIDDASLVVPPATVQQAADVDRSRAVTVRGPAGQRTIRSGGTSMRAFLGALGLPLDAIGRVELQVSTRRPIVLTGDEVRGGFSGDPACQLCQATLDAGSRPGAVSFLRPLRGERDQNAVDELVPSAGETLFVRVTSERAPLRVNTVFDSERRYRVGQPVEFGAALLDPPPSPARITWFFGDGSSEVGGPTASHTYTGPGAWPAGALVVADGRFTAIGQTVRILRTRREPQAKEPTVPPTPTPRPEASPSASTGQGSGAGGPSSAAAGLPPAPTPATSSPTSPAEPAVAETPAPAAPTPAPLVSPASGAQLATIRGRLATADAQPAALIGALTAAEALAAQDDAPAAAPPDEPPRPMGIAAGSALSGMLLVGLLSAGALTERRRARRATDLLR